MRSRTAATDLEFSPFFKAKILDLSEGEIIKVIAGNNLKCFLSKHFSDQPLRKVCADIAMYMLMEAHVITRIVSACTREPFGEAIHNGLSQKGVCSFTEQAHVHLTRLTGADRNNAPEALYNNLNIVVVGGCHIAHPFAHRARLLRNTHTAATTRNTCRLFVRSSKRPVGKDQSRKHGPGYPMTGHKNPPSPTGFQFLSAGAFPHSPLAGGVAPVAAPSASSEDGGSGPKI